MCKDERMAGALTAAQLVDLGSVVNLLATIIHGSLGGASLIKVIRAESAEVVEKFRSEWHDRLPNVTLSIEPHKTSPNMRVIVVKKDET